MTANGSEQRPKLTPVVAERGSAEGLDLDRAARLAAALEALVTDPLARPIVAELRARIEAARGEVAEVTELAAERAKRERER